MFRATHDLDRDFCVSVFVDNAGIIRFDDDWNLCFKVETHNHPSAIEPYGGAGTGLGGVIRDVLGTGLGGKPVANTDVFCVGPLDMPNEDLPTGVHHPMRILKGVVEGVRDYGKPHGHSHRQRRRVFRRTLRRQPVGLLRHHRTDSTGSLRQENGAR